MSSLIQITESCLSFNLLKWRPTPNDGHTGMLFKQLITYFEQLPEEVRSELLSALCKGCAHCYPEATHVSTLVHKNLTRLIFNFNAPRFNLSFLLEECATKLKVVSLTLLLLLSLLLQLKLKKTNGKSNSHVSVKHLCETTAPVMLASSNVRELQLPNQMELRILSCEKICQLMPNIKKLDIRECYVTDSTLATFAKLPLEVFHPPETISSIGIAYFCDKFSKAKETIRIFYAGSSQDINTYQRMLASMPLIEDFNCLNSKWLINLPMKVKKQSLNLKKLYLKSSIDEIDKELEIAVMLCSKIQFIEIKSDAWTTHTIALLTLFKMLKTLEITILSKENQNLEHADQNLEYEDQDMEYEDQNLENLEYENQNLEYGDQNLEYVYLNLEYEDQNLEYENQNLEHEDQNLEYEDQNLEYEDQNLEYEDQNLEYGDQNLEYVDPNLEDEDQNLEHEDQNLEYEDQNLEYEDQNLEYENQNLEYENQNLEHEDQNLEYEDQNLEYVDLNLEDEDQNLEHEDQNLEYENQNLEYENQNLEHEDQNLENEDEVIEENLLTGLRYQCLEELAFQDEIDRWVSRGYLWVLLEMCPNLKRLTLKNCEGFVNKSAAILGQMMVNRKLKYLLLSYCHVGVNGIFELLYIPSLSHLTVSLKSSAVFEQNLVANANHLKRTANKYNVNLKVCLDELMLTNY